MKRLFVFVVFVLLLSACDGFFANKCGEYGECVQDSEDAENFVDSIEDLEELVHLQCFQGLTSTDFDGMERYGLVEDQEGICLIIYKDTNDEYKVYSYGSEKNTKLLDLELHHWIDDVFEAMEPYIYVGTTSLIIDVEIDDQIYLSYGEYRFTVFQEELNVCPDYSFDVCFDAEVYFELLEINVEPPIYDSGDPIIFDDSLYTASLEQISLDTIVLHETYESPYDNYFAYKGTVEDVNIYKISFEAIKGSAICTADMVWATPLGEGYYLPGGGSGSCHESIFAVKDGVGYRLSGKTDIDDVEELGLSATQLCQINGLCSTEAIVYAPAIEVSQDMIDTDLDLLHPGGYDEFDYYSYMGFINGYRIYHRNLTHTELTACTDDIVPHTDLGDGYSSFSGGGSSCYEYTKAIRNGVVYNVIGWADYTPKELGFSAKELCGLLDVCLYSD